MNDITNIISTLGFPIFVAIILLYHNFSISDKFQTTINQNTKTIELLVDALEQHNIYLNDNKDDSKDATSTTATDNPKPSETSTGDVK